MKSCKFDFYINENDLTYFNLKLQLFKHNDK